MRIKERLHDDLTTDHLLRQMAGYVGNCENELRNRQSFWSIVLPEDETSGADGTGASAGDYVCARCAAISHVIA
jgi:hypothetical protein